jgi:zinc transporter 9
LEAIVFLAIMLHKAPAAFGLSAVLLRAGLAKRQARGHLIVFSLAAPVGAIVTWILLNVLGSEGAGGEGIQWWTGVLLLFSGGTFL